MEPLAEVDDLQGRLGVTFSGVDEARASALLDDASALVRNYTRQDFTRASDTVWLEATTEQWLYLPQRPVVSVEAVTIGAAPLSPGYWQLQNDALYRREGWQSRAYISTSAWAQPDTIGVSYTHGYDAVPDDVIRVVCKLAQSTWLNPEGYRSASVGGISITLDSGTVGVASLDDSDRAVLDRYRRIRRSVVLSAGVL